MILAAIDIGSNAARLLITEITIDQKGDTFFNKLNLVRVPLRLGFDVFELGYISKPKIGMVLQTMKAYKHLCNAYNVSHIKACATSAMRDAKNSADIIRKVKLETEIEIEVISGDFEAGLIYENHVAENLDNDYSYLYIDLVKENDWEEMKDVLRNVVKGQKEVVAIGSGGNINKVFSMSKRKDGKPLSLELLRDYHKELSNASLSERTLHYNLRADRADVIVPALLIYINVMRWAGAEQIYVPKIGLADGLIKHLWEEVK